MKKNVKGFTLIELLAVIVILAVIALIATPLIMNVVSQAKEGANRDAAYGVVKAVETSVMQKMTLEPEFTIPDSCSLSTDGTKCEYGATTPKSSFDINYKGTRPSAGTIIFVNNGSAGNGTIIDFGGDQYFVMDKNGKFNKESRTS